MIRWQLLTCAIALTAAHLLEITINGDQPREPLGAHTLLDELRRLDAVRLWYPGRREPERQFETPPNTQQKARRAFGLQIDERGALQPASRMPSRLNSLRLPSTAIPLNSVGGVDCSGSP
jgi:hypothetical protein